MSAERFYESQPNTLDVLGVCTSAFEVAYFLHINNQGPKYVDVIGDNEVIRLSNLAEDYDLHLYRPHLDADQEDIGFWVNRIINHRSSVRYRHYDTLVALNIDNSQFYIQKPENEGPEELIPYGTLNSRQLVNYISEAQLVTLD